MVSASHDLMFPLAGVKTLIDRRTRPDEGKLGKTTRDISLCKTTLPKKFIRILFLFSNFTRRIIAISYKKSTL